MGPVTGISDSPSAGGARSTAAQAGFGVPTGRGQLASVLCPPKVQRDALRYRLAG